jgi:hypothetical protein
MLTPGLYFRSPFGIVIMDRTGFAQGTVPLDVQFHDVPRGVAAQNLEMLGLAALERGETEVLADDRSRDVKHRLRDDPASLDREMQSVWDDYLAQSCVRAEHLSGDPPQLRLNFSLIQR